MLSIIISPNRLPPPRITETIPTTNTRSNTSEKKKKKKNSAETRRRRNRSGSGRDEKGERSRFKSFVIGSVRLGIIDFSPEFQEAP